MTMTPEELTPIVTAHQSAIARGESRMDRIEATLERIAVGQEENRQAIQASPTLRERPTDC